MKKFEPEDTIPLQRPGVQPWAFVVFAVFVVGAAAGFLALAERSAPAARPEAPPPVAVAAPPVAPPLPAPSPYAVELAVAHTQPFEPTQEMVREFETLLRIAREEYARSTEMQIRDAVYSVYSMKVYNRPDIDVLKAFRMIVDWVPDGVAARDSAGVRPAGASIPVSRAVDDITNRIASAYNDWIAAQWESYYAEQEAAYEQWVAVAEQRAAIRAAQEQAQLEAKAAQQRAIADFQEQMARNSVFGQFWRR